MFALYCKWCSSASPLRKIVFFRKMNDDVWVQPPDAPAFEPTEEEFADPLKYIESIFPIVYNTGIARIRPPKSFNPPFALDPENLKFTPRIQRICEMDAKSRTKLNFMSELTKYWELNSIKLKYPVIDQKYVDLLALKKFVIEEGGYEHVCKKKLWPHIAFLLGIDASKSQTLKNHYDRIIKPYEKFLSENETAKSESISEPKKIAIASRSRNVSRRYSRRINDKDSDKDKCDVENNAELKKLQFIGAGPKMRVPDGDAAKIQTTACNVCGTASQDRLILKCTSCGCGFHTFCLDPPVREFPKSEWNCQKCLVKMVKSKSTDPFGFEQSPSEYNVRTFGEYADNFKRNYFNRAPQTVPYEQVEREFWRLISSLEEDVSVMYGADLQTFELGSGFPTVDNNVKCEDGIDYSVSGWNLNRMPVESRSLMRFIEAQISGMKLPWLYIGMCFSAFCWHVEDHWSYSINYLHWGEAKTWYGVPSKDAEKLEQAVKNTAPELFENQPDLMHHLVTTMSPVTLMNYGVNVYRLIQNAGDFVITLPRAYHAGFNQGYNCAEAVNFCLPNWISMGRDCLQHYQSVKRYNVFCHDELISKIIHSGEKFEAEFSQCLCDDVSVALDIEKKYRAELESKGLIKTTLTKFEEIADDLRICDACDLTCFYSALTCPCSPGKLVCLAHHDKLCQCDYRENVLQFRYTIEELEDDRDTLQQRVETYTDWLSRSKSALEAWPGSKLSVNEFKDLVEIAATEEINEQKTVEKLKQAVADAEQVQVIAQQLAAKKHRTRVRTGGVVNSTTNEIGQHQQSKLKLEELQAFLDQVQTIPCELPETEQIVEVIDLVECLESDINKALTRRDMENVTKMEELYEKAISLDVEIVNCAELKLLLEAAYTLQFVNERLNDEKIEIEELKTLIDKCSMANTCSEINEKTKSLLEMYDRSLEWETKARYCLECNPKYTIDQLASILSDAEDLPTYLPTVNALQESVCKAKDWVVRVESLLEQDPPPYLAVLEGLAVKGKALPVQLTNHTTVQFLIDTATEWKDKAEKMFLKSSNSELTLTDVLTPRNNFNVRSRSGASKNRRRTETALYRIVDYSLEEPKSPAYFARNYRELCIEELGDMKELRSRNIDRASKDDNNKELYCVCRKPYSGFMLQCDLCRDWFHTTCVPLPKSIAYKMQGRSSVAALTEAIKDLKYLCPMCKRSRRPRLENVLTLLAGLEEIPLRLIEGEAVQCLFERAMCWRSKARDYLTSQEKFKNVVSKMAMKKPPETIYPVLNFKNEVCFDSSEDETCDHQVNKTEPVEVKTEPVAPKNDISQDQKQTFDEGVGSSITSDVSAPLTLAVKIENEERQVTVEDIVMTISESELDTMESLLLEGDLIEIGLDETHYLWTIVQAAIAAEDQEDEEEEEEEEEEEDIKEEPIDVSTGKDQKPKTSGKVEPRKSATSFVKNPARSKPTKRRYAASSQSRTRSKIAEK